MNSRKQNMATLVLRAAAVAVVIVGLGSTARAQQVPVPDLPALPTPPVPDEADPLLRVVDRPVSTACAGPAAVSLVVRLVSGALGVPIPEVDINDASQPLYAVCGMFPVPVEHTTCAVDEPVMGGIADQVGATPIPVSLPDPAGVGVEVVMDLDAALETYSDGAASTGLGDQVHEGLDCTTVSLLDDPRRTSGGAGEGEVPTVLAPLGLEVRAVIPTGDAVSSKSRVLGRTVESGGGARGAPGGLSGDVAMGPVELSSSGLSGLRLGMVVTAATLFGPALLATLKGMARSARS